MKFLYSEQKNQRFRRLKRFYLRNLRNLLIKILFDSGLSRLGVH